MLHRKVYFLGVKYDFILSIAQLYIQYFYFIYIFILHMCIFNDLCVVVVVSEARDIKTNSLYAQTYLSIKLISDI